MYPKMPASQGVRQWSKGDSVAYSVLVFFLVFAIQSIHIHPGDPHAGPELDPSWMQVLSFAFAQGFQWGRDVVFTYGPLGFARAGTTYDPDLYDAYLLAQAVQAAGYTYILTLVVKKIAIGWSILLVCLSAYSALLSPDAMALSSFALATFAVSRMPAQKWGLSYPLVCAFLAFLSLVKFSYFLAFFSWAVVVAAHAAVSGGYRLLAYRVFVVVVLLGAVWLMAGQSLEGFIPWVVSGMEISSGYSSAMSIRSDDSLTLFMCTFVCSLLALGIVASGDDRRHAWSRIEGALVWAMFTLAAVLAWKSAVVRGHYSVMFGLGGIVMALAGAATSQLKADPRRWILIGLMAATSILPSLKSDWISQPGHAASSLLARASERYSGAFNVLTARSYLIELKTLQVDELAEKFPLNRIRAAIGSSTMDVLSHHQGIFLAHGLNYEPRPIFQSYSAYTRRLAEINSEFISGPRAPEYLVAKLESIDGRLPGSDDPLTIVSALTGYEFVLEEEGFVLLRRKKAGDSQRRQLANGSARIGEWVSLPVVGRFPAILEAQIDLTRMGRLAALASKEPQLLIEVEDEFGVVGSYKTSIALADAGFLFSPYLRSQQSFVSFLEGKQVPVARRFRFQFNGRDDLPAMDREFEYSVSVFAPADYAPGIDGRFQSRPALIGGELAKAGICNIEHIGGYAARQLSAEVEIGSRVGVFGWVYSPDFGENALTWLRLESLDAFGSVEIPFARGELRPDVSKAYGFLGSVAAGFSMPVVDFPHGGRYRVSVLVEDGDQRVLCSHSRDVRVAH